MTLQVELVSPERIVYEGSASLVIAHTTDGEIGFQTGHVPFVGNLVPSVVRVIADSEPAQRIAVHSGFVEVADDHVTLLSDVAEIAADIDIDRARRALDRAEEALRADADDEEARQAHRRATARINAVEGTD